MQTEITYTTGNATAPQVDGPSVIAHICNDIGGWGKGFVMALSKRWAEPERAYREWHARAAENGFGLGAIQVVEVETNLYVANMVGQRGIKSTSSDPPIRYEAVNQCLQRLGEWAVENEASVHMPRIGCGLAGGEWGQIEPLILKQLCDREVAVTIYDFD